MSLVHIFDCNNWVRNQYEKDPLALRNLLSDAHFSPDLHLYVFDGFKSRTKRQEIYPGYKGNRKPAPGVDLFFESLKLFKELLGHTKQFSIELPYTEADDVINHLVKHKQPGVKVKIYSTDRDFAALVNDEVITTQTAIKGTIAADVRLYKTLVGDSSDNVKGVSRFGEKSWPHLTEACKASWIEFLEGRQEHYPITAMSDHSLGWIDENKDLLRAYWKVVDFLPLDNVEVNAAMKMGTPNFDIIEQRLKALFL